MADRRDVVVEGVTRRFGSHLAVDHVSFTIEPGEVLGLLGPNGAGKTTFMRMVCGYLQPDQGRIIVGGFDVASDARRARAKIGYVPEGAPVPTDTSPYRYLGYCARLRGLRRASRRTAVESVLRQVGLLDVAGRPIGTLSRGLRQRVAIGQALIGDPPVLVFDEPTTGLDPRQVTEARALIARLGRRRSVLLSSHLLSEVSQLCRRVVVLDRGRVMADRPVSELTSAGPGVRLEIRVAADRAGAEQILRKLPGVTGVRGAGQTVTVDGDAGDLATRAAAALVEGGIGLVALRTVGGSLEEAYLRLVGG